MTEQPVSMKCIDHQEAEFMHWASSVYYKGGLCYVVKEREGNLKGLVHVHMLCTCNSFFLSAELKYGTSVFEKWLIEVGFVAHLLSLMLCIHLAFIPSSSRVMALHMWCPCICVEQSLCSHRGSPACQWALGIDFYL